MVLLSDHQLYPDGAEGGVSVHRLGQTHASPRMLHDLHSPAALAASVRTRPLSPDAGLHHGTHGLPDGLPHAPLQGGGRGTDQLHIMLGLTACSKPLVKLFRSVWKC